MASLSDLPFETMCQVAQNLGMSDLDHLAETSRQTRAQIHLPRLERRFRIIAFFDQPSAILKLLERLARSPEISTMVRSLTALPRSSVSSRSLCSQMGRESYYRILFPRPRLSEYEDMWAFATEFNERVDQMLAVLASTNVRLLRDDTVIRVGNRVFNSDALKNELRRGNMSAFRILTLFLPRLSQVCWMVPDVRKRIFEWPGHFINITLAPPNTAVVPTDFRENAILWQFLGNTMAPAWMLELYPGQGWIRDLSVKMEANMDVQGLAECFVHLKRLHVTLVPPSNLPHRYWGSPRPLLDLPIMNRDGLRVFILEFAFDFEVGGYEPRLTAPRLGYTNLQCACLPYNLFYQGTGNTKWWHDLSISLPRSLELLGVTWRCTKPLIAHILSSLRDPTKRARLAQLTHIVLQKQPSQRVVQELRQWGYQLHVLDPFQ